VQVTNDFTPVCEWQVAGAGALVGLAEALVGCAGVLEGWARAWIGIADTAIAITAAIKTDFIEINMVTRITFQIRPIELGE